MCGALDRMIKNTMHNQSQMLLTWRDKIIQLKFNENIGVQNRKYMLNSLMKFNNNALKTQLHKVMNQLHKNSRIKKYQSKFFKHLGNCKSGKIQNIFTSWQKLPEKKNYEQILKVNKFEKNLTRLWLKRNKVSIRALRQDEIIGDNLKKRVLQNIVYKTSGL